MPVKLENGTKLYRFGLAKWSGVYTIPVEKCYETVTKWKRILVGKKWKRNINRYRVNARAVTFEQQKWIIFK